MENKKEESEATPLLQREGESVFYDVPSQSHDDFALSQQQQQQQQQIGDPNLAAYAMMAAQYEQAGYHPSDAAAAAASLAVYQQHQQHQQHQQQNMYYGQAGAGGGGGGGFPFPPQGPQIAAGGAPLFYPQTNHQHPHHQSSQFSIANNQPNQPTRPPRSSRRASPPSPSQTSSPKVSREMFQQTTTTTQPPGSYMSPPAIGFPWTNSNHHPLTEDDEKKSQSEIVEVPIPSLQDIFSTDQNLGNYGAIPSQQQQQQQQQHHHHDPQIWNAPALFVPTSTGAAATTSKSPKSKVQAVLVRTSSSGEINQLKKKGRHNSTNSTNKHHRRSNSDTPLRAAGHRRMGSGDLPPMSHRRNGSDSGSVRSRTLSTGSLPKQQQQQQLHRRQASSGSIGTFSSNISLGAVSVVSNIAKSSMFGGVDEATGKVQMHFPFEGVRLVLVDKREDALREGHLYMDGKLTDFEDFEEYTRITNALEEGIQPQWESLDRPTNMCGCDCNHCVGCMGKQELLKNPSYLLAVDSDIYRKVVGEIADAHGMPCGLFFCGHHEDVAHPSIAIAVLVVTILFLSMAYLSFVIEGA